MDNKDRVAIFIDGSNLYHSLKVLKGTKIDFEKLVKEQKYVPIVGLDLNLAFWQPTAEMNIIFDSSGNSRGLHAVLVVGIAKDNTYEKLFLIRNSWGSNWGNNGYAWITKEYLLERYRDSFYLQ